MKKKIKYLQNIDKNNTKDCFIDAFRICLSQKPYSQITVKELCATAKYSRKTFYDNFSKKDDLLSYLSEFLLKKFYYSDKKADLFHYFEFWYVLREWVILLIDQGLWEVVTDKAIQQYIEYQCKGEWNHLGKHKENKKFVFRFVAAGCFQMIYCWKEEGFQRSPQEMADLATYIVENILKEE